MLATTRVDTEWNRALKRMEDAFARSGYDGMIASIRLRISRITTIDKLVIFARVLEDQSLHELSEEAWCRVKKLHRGEDASASSNRIRKAKPKTAGGRVGWITDITADKISSILGFEPENPALNPDGDGKVQHLWRFYVGSRLCSIWSYRGSHENGRFSFNADRFDMAELFGEAKIAA